MSMTSLIDAALIDECRKLQEAVAPELSADPLYIIGSDDLGDLPYKRDYMGWADDGRCVNAALREKIGDRWQGPGRTICLDAAAIEAAAQPGQFRRCVLNVFVHELGHLLPPSKLGREWECLATLVDYHRKAIERGAATPAPEPGSPDDCHGPQFIRATLHCWCRAAAAGFDIPLRGLLTEISFADHYLPLVVGESLRMRDCTFAEIAAAPLPAFLAEQYTADVEYQKQRPERTTCQ